MQSHSKKIFLLGLAMGAASFAFAEEAVNSKELSMSTPRGDSPCPGDCSSKTPDPNYRCHEDDVDYDVYTMGTEEEQQNNSGKKKDCYSNKGCQKNCK
ncbi:MAG: hypothetical protein FJZ64_03185 [Chlamydiae bacterium]|nr:hypothetical protein [Chlamydiota bacterium]